MSDSSYRNKYWTSKFLAQVSKTIKAMRTIEGITQSELAQRAGTSQSTITENEKEDKSIELANFVRLADACGFDVTISVERKVGLPLYTKMIIEGEVTSD